MMIIVKMQGGLGNQMFQYATGLGIARSLRTDLKIDVSHPREGRLSKFELDRFRITALVATEYEIKSITGMLGTRNGPRSKSLRRVCGRLGWIGRLIAGRYVKARSFSYDPSVFKLKKDAYLQDLWQSFRYFEGIRDEILSEFSLKEVNQSDYEIAQRMQADPGSVSLHIRRGDYVTRNSSLPHLICSLDYYQKAIDYLRTELGSIRIFIFSDDPTWVKQNIGWDQSTIVELSGENRGPRDLMLMTKCRHHVIANSTFSWWGAWLSDWKSGIVCCPREWFKPENRRPVDDLVPHEWVSI